MLYSTVFFQVQLNANGSKPDRQMRSMSLSLKTDLQSRTNLKIVEEFVLKLPGKNSHQFHLIKGEVQYVISRVLNHCGISQNKIINANTINAIGRQLPPWYLGHCILPCKENYKREYTL